MNENSQVDFFIEAKRFEILPTGGFLLLPFSFLYPRPSGKMEVDVEAGTILNPIYFSTA